MNVNHAGLELLRGDADVAPGTVYYQDKRPEEFVPSLVDHLEDIDLEHTDEETFEREMSLHETVRHFNVKVKRMLDISNKFSGLVRSMSHRICTHSTGTSWPDVGSSWAGYEDLKADQRPFICEGDY